jgi:hypothetical protein
MADFLMVYHGGSMPETDDEIANEMTRWGDWMNSFGDSRSSRARLSANRRRLTRRGSQMMAGRIRSAAIRLSKPKTLRQRLH